MGRDWRGLAGLPKKTIALKESILRKPDWIAFEENNLDIAGMKCSLTLNTGEVIDSKFNENSYVEFKDIYEEDVEKFEIFYEEINELKSSLVDELLNLLSE